MAQTRSQSKYSDGYETRADLCDAQRKFIEEYGTLWPRGYNVLEGRESRVEFDAEWSEAARSRVLQNSAWRVANAAAANLRKQTEGWQEALMRRSKNVVWRRNISAARMPYLHNRWHVGRGLVPDGTTVEDCAFCEAIKSGKMQVHDDPITDKTPVTDTPFEGSRSMDEEITEIARRVNELFRK